jgi:hypothetical protein
MSFKIDDAFIREWEPRFDEPTIGGEYVREYQTIVDKVAMEIRTQGTLSQQLFLDIWKWKGAMRVIRHVHVDRYRTLYAPAFGRAVLEPPAKKLEALLGDGHKLPGIGAPTGSTILHFIHPDYMPIIDVRTVETLHEARRIHTKMRDLTHYEEFRFAIDDIKHECPNWTLRQIDKALFAYHKVVLDTEDRTAKSARRFHCNRAPSIRESLTQVC